jgi:hypothetical protein
MHHIAFAMVSFLLIVPPLAADAGMGAEEFERYTEGKTLSYAWRGAAFAQEQYLPDRQVIWSVMGGECHRGRWYEAAGQICFLYEDNPDPACWDFESGAQGLHAVPQGAGPEDALDEIAQSATPISCPAPDLGV